MSPCAFQMMLVLGATVIGLTLYQVLQPRPEPVAAGGCNCGRG